mgnify:CR=1 FL=1
MKYKKEVLTQRVKIVEILEKKILIQLVKDLNNSLMIIFIQY